MKRPLRGLWGLLACPIAAVVCVNAVASAVEDDAYNRLSTALVCCFVLVGLSFASGWLARQDLEGPPS